MTWKEIKLTTLQKMFAADGNTIPNDESVKDYLAGMPAAANEAMQMVCTAGRYLLRKVEIAHYPSENLLGKQSDVSHVIRDGKLSFSAKGAHAYYLEFWGKGTITVKVGAEEIVIITAESEKMYTTYRGTIENVDNEDVTVIISSEYKGVVKNVCLYEERYWDENMIFPASENVKYDMTNLVEDFYSFDPQNIYYEGTRLPEEYIRTSRVYDESGKVLLLNAEKPGNYTVYYRAYPDVISELTADDYVFNVAPEIAVILPLYMASQLYKDDDNGIATSYRNEFEVAFERIQNPVSLASSERFSSGSGWI